jgi:hypothetical protein
MSRYLARLLKPILASRQLPAARLGAGTAEPKVDVSQDRGYQIGGVVESRAGGRLLLHDQLTTQGQLWWGVSKCLKM